MTSWYVTLGAAKRAAGITGSERDARLADVIEDVSREIDRETHTWFIPRTDTRYYPYSSKNLRNQKLYFDADLWSLTTFKDQGGDRTMTSGVEFFLQPENLGPPYAWAEVLRSQALSFEGGSDTTQRSFEVTGLWSRSSTTVAAGAIGTGAAQSDTTGTVLTVTDGSKIDVGDTVLIDSEQQFVSARESIDIAQNTSGALTADETDTTVTLGGAPTHAVVVGEVLRIGSELMLVEAVNSTTSFEVTRAHDGSTLASHLTNADVYIFRRYTVTRGVNGTTAATHTAATAITRYVAPADIRGVVLAMVIERFQGDRSGRLEEHGRPWTSAVERQRKRAISAHRRHLIESL